MRLIDERELIRCISELPDLRTISTGTIGKIIKECTTIDAEPVRHGWWIDDMYFDEPVTRCTWCNRGFAKGHKAERFPYCPNCGAKMDLEV